MLVGTQVVQSTHEVPLVLPRTQVERRLLTEMVTVGGGMVLSQQSQRGPDADSEEEEAALGVEEHQLGPTNLVVMGRHAQQQALLKRLAREGVPAVRCVHSRLPSRAGGHLRNRSCAHYLDLTSLTCSFAVRREAWVIERICVDPDLSRTASRHTWQTPD